MNCPVHPTSVVDPAKEGAKMDFSASMSYGDYLQIDTILSAQKPSRRITMKCCSSSSTKPVSCG